MFVEQVLNKFFLSECEVLFKGQWYGNFIILYSIEDLQCFVYINEVVVVVNVEYRFIK